MGRDTFGVIQFLKYLFVKLQIILADIPKKTIRFLIGLDDMSTFTIASMVLSIVKVQIEQSP